MNIIEFIRDPQLINSDLSLFQETALRALYALPLSADQLEILRQATEREVAPDSEFSEATFVCGRRSGKSDRLAANVAVFEAATGGHERFLAPGERGHIVLIAQDMRAARVLYRYILAKLENSPFLSQLIEAVRAEEIDLTNRLTVSILPCSFRASRGFAVPVAVLDEVAFFRVEGVNVDREVIDSVRAGQATFPKSKLIKISSPYAKQGELYKDFASRQSRPNLLCFRAESWLMNPSIPQSFLDQERERDPEFFDREYRALFSDTISAAFTREAVEACVVPGRFELPPVGGIKYKAAVDPSGGGPDEFSLSICHRDGDLIIQDCLRGQRSDKPQSVVEEYASLLKTYGLSDVVGDNYSKEWVQNAFRERGITYHVSKVTASDAFLEFLPVINQTAVELLDDKRQTQQLILLERRKARSGRDALGHPPGGHDDRANALALACLELAKPKGGFFCWAAGSTSMVVNGAIVSGPAPTVDLYSPSLEKQKSLILQQMRGNNL